MFELDQVRLQITSKTDPRKKAQLGQFLTPGRIAEFMANLFKPTDNKNCSLLDPGAGMGVLSIAFLERFLSGELNLDSVSVTAFEIDDVILPELYRQFQSYSEHNTNTVQVCTNDFISEAVKRIMKSDRPMYTHAILNPPYKKITSDSNYRLQLRQAGIETVNLYSAFVALSLALLKPGGQLVAIIPRSFCNGPYYRSFREYILHYACLKHIHLFHSRDSAFSDEGVLQENVIILLERNGSAKEVVISTSTDDTFNDLQHNTFPVDRIISPNDPDKFINIPTVTTIPNLENLHGISYSLSDLGIQVSTGPVIDFRVSDFLSSMPTNSTVPLLYPGHLTNQKINWPIEGFKKANAIEINPETVKWLFPNGNYCLVKRFSSKEERHRIVATAISHDSFQYERLGFENHLNVFHQDKHGLPPTIAYGLAAYLNSSAVDEYFRLFSGHTQVNATDLKRLKYPSYQALHRLGELVLTNTSANQEDIEVQLMLLSA